ncbi:MAG: 2-amino-4-hydroxy-6-hydroxymethyldihydropteridine diphosphokinase [Dermabacter sp.]|nr:2-amino-4-hydroxy-6-hydroxymethyldihydropteridine diphosphokinase [Dermabacter sp.]
MSEALGAERRLDEITVQGVRVHGKHGVFPEEKRDGHDFLIDARLWLDARSAGRSDALTRSVSYADIAQIIEEVVSGESVDLIESLAERICSRIFAEHPLVRRARVSIHKPTAPLTQTFASVGFTTDRDAPPQRAVIALGSSVGEREEHLRAALALIDSIPQTRVIAASDVIETDAVSLDEGADDPPYLNAALLVETRLSPWQLLEETARIELMRGRTREVRWGPRTLDLDLVTWGPITLDDPALTLPHPRAHERPFVLAPMTSLARLVGEALELPGHGDAASVLAKLRAENPETGERRVPVPGFSSVTGVGERA